MLYTLSVVQITCSNCMMCLQMFQIIHTIWLWLRTICLKDMFQLSRVMEIQESVPTWSSTKKEIKIGMPWKVQKVWSHHCLQMWVGYHRHLLPRDEKQITNYKTRVSAQQRVSNLWCRDHTSRSQSATLSS